jgi:hypothetical protein
MESVGLSSLVCSSSEIEKRNLETLWEKHRLTTLEIRVLKKTDGPRKAEEREGCKREMSNEDLEDLYVS